MMTGQKLNQWYRTAREATGKTQVQIANAMQWSPSKVMRIETGETGVSTSDAQALSKYLISTIETLPILPDGFNAETLQHNHNGLYIAKTQSQAKEDTPQF